MFERAHHRRIATVLQALDAQRLQASACYFGGGTAIALRHGEYRESVDIDFLVSDLGGYCQLRQWLTGPDGLAAITRPASVLTLAREVRADQYGLRTLLLVDGEAIKFEIVLEGRITLDTPGAADAVCGVSTLTPLDSLATKLLANSDRWRDSAAFSRDLIDLAMLAPARPLLQKALDKAGAAYGPSVQADLTQAIKHLQDRPDRLDRCMQAMGITTLSRAQLWQRIKRLAGAQRRVAPKLQPKPKPTPTP